MINPKLHNIKLLACCIVIASGLVPIVTLDGLIRYVWLFLCFVALCFYVKLALVPRKCGHGFVTSYGIFFFPFVINPCPVCGDYISTRET